MLKIAICKLIVCIFTNVEDLNVKIKRLRKEKGLSQSELASKIGISQTAYASIESGKTKSVTIEIGKGLSKILNVDFGILFGVDIKDNTPYLEELVKENQRLKQDLDVYRNIYQILKEEKMVVSPLNSNTKSEPFLGYDDKDWDEIFLSIDERDEQFYKKLETDPFLRSIFEDGLVTPGWALDVWKKYKKDHQGNKNK